MRWPDIFYDERSPLHTPHGDGRPKNRRATTFASKNACTANDSNNSPLSAASLSPKELDDKGNVHGLNIAITIVALAVLLLGLVSTVLNDMASPPKYDYSQLTFNWHNDPASYLEPVMAPNFTYNVVLEAHAHTTHSDGDMTPEQLVEYYRANGFNAAIVSDHNTVAGGLAAERYAQRQYPGQFVVIPAQEYSCCRVHMNFINIRETIPVVQAFPTDSELKEAIDRVHALGGLVVVNHIPWSNSTTAGYPDTATLPNHPNREDLVAMGVDGFELVNGQVFDTRSYRFVQNHNAQHPEDPLLVVTGNDVHRPQSVYSWTVLQTRNGNQPLTAQAVFAELQAGRTDFLFEPSGTRQHAVPQRNSRYWLLAPLTNLGEYFKTYYDRQRGMYSFTGEFCQPQIFEVHTAAILSLAMYLVVAVVSVELVSLALFFGKSGYRRRARWRVQPHPSAS
ncbi:hypothetical protein H4R34_001322 [Dimargaris verticillata]|uniref:Polymerase/histidinol phosphatase N-terminal domain-containing protein n=1 Tax=Dimargaris verticillata TaxID=2761393 RepID=A0A9W8B4Y8_9FUNG|nr:hypothetical protein H4R34_001322 [Dimargaris verticillata]